MSKRGKCIVGIEKYKGFAINVLTSECEEKDCCVVSIYMPKDADNVNYSLHIFESACVDFTDKLSFDSYDEFDIEDAPKKEGFMGVMFIIRRHHDVKTLLKAAHAFVDKMTTPIDPKVAEVKERLTKLLDKHDVVNHAIENHINRLKCETEFDTHLWPSNGYSEEIIGIKIEGDLVNPYKKKKKRK